MMVNGILITMTFLASNEAYKSPVSTSTEVDFCYIKLDGILSCKCQTQHLWVDRPYGQLLYKIELKDPWFVYVKLNQGRRIARIKLDDPRVAHIKLNDITLFLKFLNF